MNVGQKVMRKQILGQQKQLLGQCAQVLTSSFWHWNQWVLAYIVQGGPQRYSCIEVQHAMHFFPSVFRLLPRRHTFCPYLGILVFWSTVESASIDSSKKIAGSSDHQVSFCRHAAQWRYGLVKTLHCAPFLSYWGGGKVPLQLNTSLLQHVQAPCISPTPLGELRSQRATAFVLARA